MASRPSRGGGRSASPAGLPAEAAARPPVASGLRGLMDGLVGPLLLLFPAPLLCLVLAFTTSDPKLPDSERNLEGLAAYAGRDGWDGLLAAAVRGAGAGTREAWAFLLVFNLGALLLYWWPGQTKYGPETPAGHLPSYTDNGVAHCLLSSLMFLGGSNLGLGWYDLGVIYEHHQGTIGALNVFGLIFCGFLYIKGLAVPSGAGVQPDCGPSGYGPVFDYYWGMELYPRIYGVDVKKFVNCRFSMTYWQLAGISFAWKSYQKHGFVDPAIVLCALSQYLYLVKFFVWEIGYMRSIDIIVDRAGFYETWGCFVWVPSVYTLHTRLLVSSPSKLSWPVATAIFIVGLAGVLLNFWADHQRQVFREQDGKCKVWGKAPIFITAQYTAVDSKTGKRVTRSSLLLASGWWGVARHFQYAFELLAAWSWGLLGMGAQYNLLPLFYPVFLTILLVHRAKRDEEKCLVKYGEGYAKYMRLVRYKILPYVY